MEADDCQCGAHLGSRQSGVHHGGHTGGVEVDVGAGLAGKPALALAVQRDEARYDVFVGGIDDGVGADLQSLVQTGADQVNDHQMLHAKGFESQRRAQSDRPGAEYDDFVRRFGFAAVDAMARDGHRFVQRGHFPRDVVRDDF